MSRSHRFIYAICFDDVDAAGIVYFPRYFHFCHLAFEDLFNQAYETSYPHVIQTMKVGFPTVHVNADFTRPLRYGDTLTIHLTVEEIKTSSFRTNYVFENAAGETNFVARITTVYTDLVAKRAQELPHAVRRFLSGEAM